MVLIYGLVAIIVLMLHIALLWPYGPVWAVATAPLSASAATGLAAVCVARRGRASTALVAQKGRGPLLPQGIASPEELRRLTA